VDHYDPDKKDSYLLVMGVVFCCLLVLAGRSRGSQLTQRRVPLLARPEVPLSRKLCRMPHPTGICVERRLPQATNRLPSTKRADLEDPRHNQADADPRPHGQVPAVCAARIYLRCSYVKYHAPAVPEWLGGRPRSPAGRPAQNERT
jgi:hypothetical protein